MKYPKMIIFDYGHTLLYEPDWDTVRGNAELLKYVTKNPNQFTLEDVMNAAELFHNQHLQSVRKQMGYDISARVGNRIMYEYLGLEFSLSPLEMEDIYWTAATPGAVMPDADKMLNYLSGKGIRSAVISNLGWSGEALTLRFKRLLPNHKFEFVMTSSDYLFRKPSRYLFDIALQKARLDASEVWYCGDNPCADVMGASAVGIFPVWYDNATEKNYKDRSCEVMPTCKHLHIHEWREMVEVLRLMES